MDSQFYDNHQTFPEIDPVTGELRYPETNQYMARQNTVPGPQYSPQYPYPQGGAYAPVPYPAVSQPYQGQRQGYPVQNPSAYQIPSAGSYQQTLDAARLNAANEENSRLRAELEELRKLRERAEKEIEENKNAAAMALNEAENVRRERDTAIQQAEVVRAQNETILKQAENDLAAVREEAEKKQQETLAQFRMEIAAKDNERQQKLSETRSTIEEQWRRTQAELQRLEEERRKLEEEKSHVTDLQRAFAVEKERFAAERQKLDEDAAATEQAKKQLENEKSNLESAKSNLESEKSNLESARQQAEQERISIEATKLQFEQQRHVLAQNKQLLDQDKALFEQNVQKFNSDRNALRQTAQKLAADKASLDKRVQELGLNRVAFEESVQQLNQERSAFEQDYQRFQSDLSEFERQKAEAEQSRAALAQDREALEQGIQRLNVDRSEFERQREAAEQDKIRLEEERLAAERLRHQLDADRAALEESRQQSMNELAARERLLAETERQSKEHRANVDENRMREAESLRAFFEAQREEAERIRLELEQERARLEEERELLQTEKTELDRKIADTPEKMPSPGEQTAPDEDTEPVTSSPFSTLFGEEKEGSQEHEPSETSPELTVPEEVHSEPETTLSEDTYTPEVSYIHMGTAAGEEVTGPSVQPEETVVASEPAEESKAVFTAPAEVPEMPFTEISAETEPVVDQAEDYVSPVFEPFPELPDLFDLTEPAGEEVSDTVLPSELFEPLVPFEITAPVDFSEQEEPAEINEPAEQAEPAVEKEETASFEPQEEVQAQTDDGFSFADDLPSFEKIETFDDVVSADQTEDQSFSDLLNQFSTQLDLSDLPGSFGNAEELPDSGFSIVDTGFDSGSPVGADVPGFEMPEKELQPETVADEIQPERFGVETFETQEVTAVTEPAETDKSDADTVVDAYVPVAEEYDLVPEEFAPETETSETKETVEVTVQDEEPEIVETPVKEEEPETDSDGFSFIVSDYPGTEETVSEQPVQAETEMPEPEAAPVKVPYDFTTDLFVGLDKETEEAGPETVSEQEPAAVPAEQEQWPVFFDLGDENAPADFVRDEEPSAEESSQPETPEVITEAVAEEPVVVSQTEATVKVSEPITVEEENEGDLFDFDSAVDDLAAAVLKDNAWLYSMNNLAPTGEEVMSVEDLTSKYYVNEVDCSYPAFKEVSSGFPAGSCTAVISSVPFCAYAFVRALACPEEIGEGTVMLGTRKLTHNDLIYIGSDRLVEKKRKALDWLMSTIGGAADQKRAKILTLLEQAGMSGLADIEIDSLSYSQRMLILLVAVSFSNTPVVLINDPQFEIEEVDVNSACAVFKLLADSGKTVIVAGHSPRLMRSVANRVIAIHYGNPVFTGSYRRFIEDNCEALVLFHTDNPEEMEEILSEDERFVVVRDRDIIELQRAENSTAGESEAIEAAKEAGVPVENLRNGDKGFSIAYKEVFKARPRI